MGYVPLVKRLLNECLYSGLLKGGGGSAGTSFRGPESQEGARESPKCPIALAIDVFFIIIFFCVVFSTIFSLYRTVIR